MIDTAMPEVRAEWHLDNWSRWMRDWQPRLWYPWQSPLACRGSSDFDDLVHEVDVSCARAVDALVEGLPKPLHVAVQHVKLGTVWTFHVEPRELYEEARTTVGRGLTARGFW